MSTFCFVYFVSLHPWNFCCYARNNFIIILNNIFLVSSSSFVHTYVSNLADIFLIFPSKISSIFLTKRYFIIRPPKKEREIFWFFVRSDQIKDIYQNGEWAKAKTIVYQKIASLIRLKASKKRTLENPLW